MMYFDHELKIHPQYYQAKLDGLKPWEFRDTRDRKFEVGQTAVFREYIELANIYTRCECKAVICYIHAPLSEFCIFTHGPIEILK